ncbi:uncharacterized protein CCOS01_12351, partial [Colletotrichum costaricense]
CPGVSTNSDDPAPNGTGSCPSWPGRQPVPSEASTRFAREIPSKCRTLQMIPPISSKLNGSPRTCERAHQGDPAGCASARTSMGTVPTHVTVLPFSLKSL